MPRQTIRKAILKAKVASTTSEWEAVINDIDGVIKKLGTKLGPLPAILTHDLTSAKGFIQSIFPDYFKLKGNIPNNPKLYRESAIKHLEKAETSFDRLIDVLKSFK